MLTHSESPRRFAFIAKYWGLLLILTGAILLTFLTAYRLNRTAAEAQTEQSAATRAQLGAALIASEFQKYRMLPLALSDYPNTQISDRFDNIENNNQINIKLEQMAKRTDSAAIYIIDRHGKTVYASNWNTPASFIGQNYGFRPYFRDAMLHGSAEQFALGTVSRRPGLFLAHRLTNGQGVVVVKVEFDRIEATWGHRAGPTIVRDANGVVIMTSKPAWRLRATQPLAGRVEAAVKAAKLYGTSIPVQLAPDLVFAPDGARATEASNHSYRLATVPIPVSGWTLTAMEPVEPEFASADAKSLVTTLVAALLALTLFGIIVRSNDKKAMQLAAKQELERQVELRTVELREANQKLVQEHAVRERNEEKLRVAREELAQSNRLATLGQITAGVSHEINQPLAAMRAFAENALVMLGTPKWPDAAANLQHIVSLTARIGEITEELRSFSRRDMGTGPVNVRDAIDGSLLLVGDRIRQKGVAIQRQGDSEEALVAVNRIRLEQILINLLQNAMDAMEPVPHPQIRIATRVFEDRVTIALTDNGPGIPPKARRLLFKSFATQKPDGMGLGLVISRELAREVGGELTHEPSDHDPGTTFLIKLPRP